MVNVFLTIILQKNKNKNQIMNISKLLIAFHFIIEPYIHHG